MENLESNNMLKTSKRILTILYRRSLSLTHMFLPKRSVYNQHKYGVLVLNSVHFIWKSWDSCYTSRLMKYCQDAYLP